MHKMASSDELMIAAMRFSLSSRSSLRWRSTAALSCSAMALGQQRALVDDGADEVRQLVLRVLDAGNVQVAGEACHRVPTRNTTSLTSLAPCPWRCWKGHGHFVGVFGLHKWQQEVQRRIVLRWLEQAQRHGVAGQYQAFFVHHHQGQRYVGKQSGKSLGGAFCFLLRIAKRLVLDFQFGLVICAGLRSSETARSRR